MNDFHAFVVSLQRQLTLPELFLCARHFVNTLYMTHFFQSSQSHYKVNVSMIFVSQMRKMRPEKFVQDHPLISSRTGIQTQVTSDLSPCIGTCMIADILLIGKILHVSLFFFFFCHFSVFTLFPISISLVQCQQIF
jgi:hypothetical protein